MAAVDPGFSPPNVNGRSSRRPPSAEGAARADQRDVGSRGDEQVHRGTTDVGREENRDKPAEPDRSAGAPKRASAITLPLDVSDSVRIGRSNDRQRASSLRRFCLRPHLSPIEAPIEIVVVAVNAFDWRRGRILSVVGGSRRRISGHAILELRQRVPGGEIVV